MSRLREFVFINANANVAVETRVDPTKTVEEVIAQLTKIDKVGLKLKEDEVCLLSFQEQFLQPKETLERIPAGSKIDILIDGMLGAHSRLALDGEGLRRLCDANPDRLKMKVIDWIDEVPSAFEFILTGFAGPVIDEKKMYEELDAFNRSNLRDSLIKPENDRKFLRRLRPLMNPDRSLKLVDKFAFRISVNDEYPYQPGPDFFYLDEIFDSETRKYIRLSIPFHTNVRPTTRHACLFLDWKDSYTLTDCVRRFTRQISWIGFDIHGFDNELQDIHLLNDGALEWIKEVLPLYPNTLPFPTRTTKGPIQLRDPDKEAIVLTREQVADIT
jgi:hypothetical protein